MGVQDHQNLSRRARQIMDIVYQKKEATAVQVLEDIPDPPSYTTVRTLLRLLENKGHLKHRQDGPRYIFYATMPREEAQGEIIMEALFEFIQPAAGSTWHNDLLNTLIKSFLYMGRVMLCVLALRRTSASIRHRVWAEVLFGLLLLPLSAGLLTTRSVPVPEELMKLRTSGGSMRTQRVPPIDEATNRETTKPMGVEVPFQRTLQQRNMGSVTSV